MMKKKKNKKKKKKHLAHSWLEEEEEGRRRRRRKLFSKLGYIRPNIKKKKLKISESSTLSLQGDVREYIDTIYYGTLHILEDLI
jgi:hypothetical protein